MFICNIFMQAQSIYLQKVHLYTWFNDVLLFVLQIKQVWKEAPIEGGLLDYLKFVAIIKRGKDDE
jgi:hypothetical protein